ncbi:MAG: hypothetical protein IPK82_27490 [Polyangiaceae bacterium]|nr:hypothetical protein [Polyangiaceae bacterium]
MKARFVAGVVLSLLMLTSVSAWAAPKKSGKGKVKEKTPAAAVVKAKATAPVKSTGKSAKAAKKSTKVNGTTVPASWVEVSSEKAQVTPHETAAPAANGKVKAQESRVKALGGLSRFIASGIPLAEVRDGRIKAVGGAKLPCGAKANWAKTNSRWQALDAWGKPAGVLSVGGSGKFDGTGCHRVWFAEGTGRDGMGVFVSTGSGYSAAASAEWKVDDVHKKLFDKFYTSQEGAWVDGKVDNAHARRTLYFQLPKQVTAEEGSPTEKRPIHWAVSGGPVLVVAYVGSNGQWKVGHVLPPNGKVNAYEPLAVMDMNGDGMPEIVVHEEAGGVFSDRVLSFDAGSMRWETAVEGPGGATR